MNGIIFLNKPAGFTSFDAVAKMRGITKTRKIGHGGTLDPMATGVLPILLGTAARVCDIVPETNKRYTALIRLGITTDTQDITGKILSTSDRTVTEADILSVLPQFTGNISQTPPMYSAVRVGGKRLYDLARKGLEIERPKRTIDIRSLDLLKIFPEKNEFILDVRCSKGSYIRTLAADIGDTLGCGAVLASLTRTEAFGYSLESCHSFQELEEAAAKGALRQFLIGVDTLFSFSPQYVLSEYDSKLHLNGVHINLSRLSDFPETDGFIRIYDGSGSFLSLSEIDRDLQQLKPVKYFFVRENQ